MLDTGTYLPKDTTSATYTKYGYLKARELIESSASGWKGPYTEFTRSGSNTYELNHPSYHKVRIFRNQDINWIYPNDSANTCLSGSISCSVYVCISGVPEKINKALDIKIDGTEGANTGNFKYDSTYGCKKGMVYDKSLSPANL